MAPRNSVLAVDFLPLRNKEACPRGRQIIGMILLAQKQLLLQYRISCTEHEDYPIQQKRVQFVAGICLPIRPKKQASREAAIEVLEADGGIFARSTRSRHGQTSRTGAGRSLSSRGTSIRPSLPSPFALSQNSKIITRHLANPTNESNAIPKVQLNILQVLHPVCPL